MSPAAFSPLRRRGFLQARSQVEVSWTYARVHGEVRVYLKQPQVEPGSRCACEVGMRAQRKNIKGEMCEVLLGQNNLRSRGASSSLRGASFWSACVERSWYSSEENRTAKRRGARSSGANAGGS